MNLLPAGLPGLGASHIVEGKQNDELRISIRSLVKYLESSLASEHGITDLANRFRIKRRRLYDIINVFEAIGFCQKTDLDRVRWNGRGNIMSFIENVATDPELYNCHRTAGDLFPVCCSVGISSLALSFLRLYYALGTNVLDIRIIGKFLSRGTTRYKSTLCKLYQISYILGAIDITVRNGNQACQVTLHESFQRFLKKPAAKDPLSLESLLNRRDVEISENLFRSRMKEIQVFVASVNGKAKSPGGVSPKSRY